MWKGPNCLLHHAKSIVTLFLLGLFSLPPHDFDTLVPLIHLPILVRRSNFALACCSQHLVAATCYFMHPHNVHDVQADTGADPGYPASPGQQVKGLGAIDSIHATVVDWHYGNTDHKED